MDIQKEREAFEKEMLDSRYVAGNISVFWDKKTQDYDIAITELRMAWHAWQAAKAQAVPAKLVLELEKGRFKEYEFKALLRQSLRASKIRKLTLNWVHVMGMLGTGSTVAHRICEALGINPDGTKFELIEAQEPTND